jgi:hypothetical protein
VRASRSEARTSRDAEIEGVGPALRGFAALRSLNRAVKMTKNSAVAVCLPERPERAIFAGAREEAERSDLTSE